MAGLFFGTRTLPGTHLGILPLAGLRPADLTGRLLAYNHHLQSQLLTITIRGQTKQYTLADLGLTINYEAMAAQPNLNLQPVISFNAPHIQAVIARDFSSVITVPQNASLRLTSQSQIEHLPAKAGEAIDLPAFSARLTESLASARPSHIEPPIIPAAPLLTEADIAPTATFAADILHRGFTLSLADKTFPITPLTLRRLLIFTVQPHPNNSGRYRLVTQLEPSAATDYLVTILAPLINRSAQNARFVIGAGGALEQTAAAEPGQTLDVPASLQQLNTALARHEVSSELVVIISQPAIQKQADIESLNLTSLLATGVTNFAGSPANRLHNIKVGTARYHGLLIPPGATFSFNQFLGPVTAAAGYKPELVIKHNKTIPEYGGGLCQVSTTMFRAAALAGLKIDERRNHAYAVRYYGSPGFDATIYPPRTDFKFTNDTDGYLLIQTSIVGTKLSIELWGQSDGRSVVIDGPHSYDRQPDGAVKAILKRLVRRGDTMLHDDTFYSRYRSPNLFPRPNENPLP